MSWQRNPGIFENSLIPRYKLKKNISLIFDRGRDFCILLDFPVHLLLSGYNKIKIFVFEIDI